MARKIEPFHYIDHVSSHFNMEKLAVKRKIAVIGLKGLPAFGGAARAMESVIDLLKSDYDFTIYSIESHTNKGGQYNGYEQIVFKSCRNKLLNTFIYYWKSMLHCIVKGKYDLIHMNHATSGLVIPFLKVRYKVITTLRGVYNSERFDDKFSKLSNFLFKVFQEFTFKFSDVLVSVSKYELEFVKRRTRKPALHIPNGINLDEKVIDEDLEHSNFILFAAGRIYGVKGCDLFLKALRDLDYREKALVIGDLNHDAKYKKLLKRLSIGRNIEFIDLIREKSILMKYLKEAKFFVFPSRVEGMSNMLLEVASMKCPVICSDIPANTSVFDDDDVTYFKSGDYKDLAEKISWALQNEGEIRSKAEKAFNKAKRKYTWHKVAEQYRNVYEQMLNDH